MSFMESPLSCSAGAVLWASSNAWAERRGGRDCGRVGELGAPRPDRKFALPSPKTASQLEEGKLFRPLPSLRAKETSVMCHKTIISIFPSVLAIGICSFFSTILLPRQTLRTSSQHLRTIKEVLFCHWKGAPRFVNRARLKGFGQVW